MYHVQLVAIGIRDQRRIEETQLQVLERFSAKAPIGKVCVPGELRSNEIQPLLLRGFMISNAICTHPDSYPIPEGELKVGRLGEKIFFYVAYRYGVPWLILNHGASADVRRWKSVKRAHLEAPCGAERGASGP